MHLLSKLKSYGDKGGLDYIVKTQKLDKIESKHFENRVSVEAYDPQKDRDEQESIAKESLKSAREEEKKSRKAAK